MKHRYLRLWHVGLLALVVLALNGWGTAVAAPNATYTENFDTVGNWIGSSPTAYGTQDYENAAHPEVTFHAEVALRQTSAAQDGYPGTRSGTYAWRLRDAAGSLWQATITTGGVGDFSVWVRRWDNSPDPNYIVEYSVDNGTSWTVVQTINNTWLGSSDWKQVTGTINTSNGAGDADDIIIRIRRVGGERLMVDDFEITDYPDGGGGDVAPTVSSTNPANNATGVAVTADLSVTFSEAVNVMGNWFQIACPTSGTRLVGDTAVSGGPTIFTINPNADFAENETCTVTIYAAQVTDQDSDDPPDNMTADYIFNFTTINPSGITYIHQVQGSGSAVIPGTYTVEAIVTGDYQGATAVDDYKLDGFFVQEEDADADGDPATSEGIFVYCQTCPTAVAVGDLVQVTGVADEFFGMSQLSATTAGAITVISSGNALPTPAAITLPVPGVTATDLAGAQAQINAYFEPFEGMLVTVNGALTATEYFELSRYGQVVLAQDGRFRQFTDANTPSAAGYTAHLIDKARRTIILDDDSNQQNHALFENVAVFHPTPGFSISNYFRGGDTITDLTGVLHWSFAGLTGTDAWRIRPVTSHFTYNFTPVNARSVTPDDVGGNTAVASFNVLNYFTTLNARGAHSTAELDRQAAKIVAAIEGLNADVIGVMEIENNNDGAIADLVSRLNAAAGAGTYAYIATGTVGTDAITVGVIYKPGRVTPVGAAQILTNPLFTQPNGGTTQRNRPAVAQTFDNIYTGERFTVVVNHLKSKGSCPGSGADADQGDGQGCWNDTRQQAAAYMVNTWIPALATTVGDPDFLIIGDLNAYRREDPITNIISAGYADLLDDWLGAAAYGYVFDGQLGYLDHALASPTLYDQVTGVAQWRINADEVNLLDYNDTIQDTGEQNFDAKPSALPLYEANAYRSSDHDPVLVGLFDYDLSSAPASYGYAWHARGDILHLGSEWLADRGPADDVSDGVARTPGVAWTPGTNNGSVDVTVAGEVCISNDCFLNAWVDWDNSGGFDAGEQIFNNQAVREGVTTLTFAVPGDLGTPPACFNDAISPCYARFRLTETADDGTRAPVSFTGGASTGEVEDYAWNFATPTAVTLHSLSVPNQAMPLLLAGVLALLLAATAVFLKRRT